MLEVEEQTVRAGHGDLGVERHGRAGRGLTGFAVGVDVQVGEVAGAQRDQVAVRAEVGLQVGDRLAVLGDGQLDRKSVV